MISLVEVLQKNRFSRVEVGLGVSGLGLTCGSSCYLWELDLDTPKISNTKTADPRPSTRFRVWGLGFRV